MCWCIDRVLALVADLCGGLFHGVLRLRACCNHRDKVHRRVANSAPWPSTIPKTRSRLGKQSDGIPESCTLRGAVRSVRQGKIMAREVLAQKLLE